MARIEKTVFISYRRADVYTALAVYENLKNQGYDVFFDYSSISSGDFEQIITSNIRGRAHFVLILTPTALDRCNEPGDWLRREIEIAIDEKRNIIPLFFKAFRFGTPSISESLTGKLRSLSRYNGLNVHEDYFDEAMRRLRTQYLNIPLNTVLHPVSTEVQKVVREEQVAADKALEQIEDVHELVKGIEAKPITPNRQLASKPVPAGENKAGRVLRHSISERTKLNPRLIGGIAGGLLVITLFIWLGLSLLNNRLTAGPEPTTTLQPVATRTPQPETTNTPSSPTKTSIPPTPTLRIGSTMQGNDGMTLLYVPAGEFMMGDDADDALAECQRFRNDCQRNWFVNEEPPHSVNIDAFWIDRTEVTVQMYHQCVEADACNEPTSKASSTHSNYYSNAEFENYPVIFVDWSMANNYCEWANRRLPTEAEWEKAARGNNESVYPWGNVFDGTLVNFCDKNCSLEWANTSFDDKYSDVAPVGSYMTGKSFYGVLDMAGNVGEWVADWYDDTYYHYSFKTNPTGASSGTHHVWRGNSWYGYGNDVRSTNRFYELPNTSNNSFGFRCAMSATP